MKEPQPEEHASLSWTLSHGAVLDADTFHILTTDIEDAVYGRIEECRRVVVGDRLDLALIQHEGRL